MNRSADEIEKLLAQILDLNHQSILKAFQDNRPETEQETAVIRGDSSPLHHFRGRRRERPLSGDLRKRSAHRDCGDSPTVRRNHYDPKSLTIDSERGSSLKIEETIVDGVASEAWPYGNWTRGGETRVDQLRQSSHDPSRPCHRSRRGARRARGRRQEPVTEGLPAI